MAYGFDDPFANPFGDNPFAARPRQQTAALPPLQPAEEESILSKLGTTALGGLGYVGGALDKALGGRAIRGLLGGRPEELASIIPFSDKMGLTDEANAVSGKELLGFDKNDDSWSGFLGGMGAEMLLDPGTYLTFGGKTAIGQAAAKANKLPKITQPITREAGGLTSGLKKIGSLFNPMKQADMDGTLAAQMRGVPAASPDAVDIAKKLGGGATAADVGDQPLAALATLRLPFMESPFAALGTGDAAQNFANKLSSVKDWAAYNKVGRAVTPLFDNRLHKFGPSPETELAQRGVRASADELAEKTPELIGKFLEQRKVAETLGMMNPATARGANRELTGLLEGTITSSIRPEFNTPEAKQLIASLQNEYKRARTLAAGEGRQAAKWDSKHGVKYAPRQLTSTGEEFVAREGGASRQALNPYNANDLARNELLDLPGGTNAVNALFQDPAAMLQPYPKAGVGQNLAKAARNIRAKYLNWNPLLEPGYIQMHKDFKAGNLPMQVIDPATNTLVDNPAYLLYQKLTAEKGQSRKLSRMATGDLAQQFATAQQGPNLGLKTAQNIWGDLVKNKPIPFANNPIGEAGTYRLADETSNQAARGFVDILAAKASRGAGDGTMDVLSALKASKYNNDNMKDLLVQHFQQAGILKPKEKWSALKNVHIPGDVAADLTRYGQTFAQPRELNPILNAFDSVTNLTKASQTTTFPFTIPTLARNALTEGYVNLLGGAKGVGENPLMNWIRPYLNASGLRSGQAVDDLTKIPGFAGLNAQQATKRLHELAHQHGVTMPADRVAAAELVGRGAHTSDVGAGVLAPMGQPQKTALQSAKEGLFLSNPNQLSVGERINPLKIKGVTDVPETTFAPVKAAQEMMHNVDETGRLAAFTAYLTQGFEPAAAAAKAKEMRMNPGALTGFERDVMKRLIPYYSWLRTSVPGMLGEIAQQPGGIVGRSIRATNDLRQGEGLIPDAVGEGVALPIGGRQEDGTQRYLSGLGLPFEELGKIASGNPAPFQRVGQQLLGNLNPMLKGPLESIFGVQAFSGRELADLRPRYGSSTADQWIANSPLGTLANRASKFADPRKGVSGAAATLFSPARITDVDMNRAQEIEGRQLLEQQLRANPAVRSFDRLYVPEEFVGSMSPQDQQLMRLYATMLQRSRERNAASNPR